MEMKAVSFDSAVKGTKRSRFQKCCPNFKIAHKLLIHPPFPICQQTPAPITDSLPLPHYRLMQVHRSRWEREDCGTPSHRLSVRIWCTRSATCSNAGLCRPRWAVNSALSWSCICRWARGLVSMDVFLITSVLLLWVHGSRYCQKFFVNIWPVHTDGHIEKPISA